MKGIICEICGKSFSNKFSLNRHNSRQHNSSTQLCVVCKKNFKSSDKLLVHQLSVHNVKVDWIPEKWCECCQEEVAATAWSYHLRTNAHKKNSAQPVNNLVKTVKSIFNERIETLMFENENDTVLDINTFFTTIKNTLILSLADLLAKHLAIKVNCELFCEFMKRNDTEDEILISIKSFQTKMVILQQSSNFEIFWKNALDKIQTKMQEFQERDSGWALLKIIHLELNVNNYQALEGSQFIPLPTTLKNKKACVNVINLY